jgi:hypothetical protein
MAFAQILSLKPNVSEPEALRMFSSFGFGKLYWTLRNGPLQRIASMYVPFWLYRSSYSMNRTNVTRWFALDAVDGSLDPFEFPRVPGQGQLISLETRNLLPAGLDPTLAEQRLREKVLRLIFQQGFFKLRDTQLEIIREPLEFHVPYWLAVHGNSNPNGSAGVRCRVLDAVRRKFEGAKASAFFEHWLA